MNTVLAKSCGLTIAPCAWAVNMQLGQMLPYPDCAAKTVWTLLAAVMSVFVSAAGAWISSRAYQVSASRSGRFVAGLSAAAGAAFVFALLLQVAAALMVDACAR